MKQPQFKATRPEFKIIQAIVDRMERVCMDENIPFHRVNSLMDIEVCHCSGCPLDLEGLRDADRATFGHDVFGIRKYLDRSTGELTEFFVPRCALPVRANS